MGRRSAPRALRRLTAALGVLVATGLTFARDEAVVDAQTPPAVAQPAPDRPAPDRPAPDRPAPDRLASVLTLARSARARDALAQLDAIPAAERDDLRARLLRAVLAARVDRPEVVLEALGDGRDVVVELPEAMRAPFSRMRAAAHAAMGSLADAANALETITTKTPRDRALLAEWRARDARDLATRRAAMGALADAIRENANDVDTFALRRCQAELELALGDVASAEAHLHALFLERPEHPDAADLERWLRASHPSALTSTLPEAIARAERMVASHRARDAVAVLEAARPAASVPAGDPERRHFERTWATTLYEARRYGEAVPALEAAARRLDEPRLLFLAARARLRGDDEPAALRALSAFAHDHASDGNAPEAAYLVGMTHFRANRPREARRELARFVEGRLAGRAPRSAREARFALALTELDLGHASAALPLLRSYRERSTVSVERARASYWIGRAESELHHRAEALAAYRDAMRAEPLGWYTLMGAHRLEALGIAASARVDEAGFGGPTTARTASTAPTLPETARFFASIAMDREAAQSLRPLERDLVRASGPRAMIELYELLGDSHRAYRAAASITGLAAAPRGDARWAWEHAYPRPFAEPLARALEGTSLDDSFVYAVMRQESAFDPEVVSIADAIGLLQLLPDTAARFATRSGVTFGRELLYRPEWNTRFGVMYLEELRARFGEPLCFAAYNAGEHRVDEWVARVPAHGQELDRFVEAIPFAQTRNYVRRVTASHAHYVMLDADETAPVRLPELALTWDLTRRVP